MSREIKLYDTTLRDGTQGEGVSFSMEDKVRIAQRLDALGVHYISDVLGGYVLGLAWLAASTAAFSIWRVERGRRPVEPIEGLEPEAATDLRPNHAA